VTLHGDDNYGRINSECSGWLRDIGAFVPHYHPDQFELAQFGGALVWRVTQKADAPRCVCKRGGFDPSHRSVSGRWNENPKPFVWTAKVEAIVEKIERARGKLEAIKPGCTQPRRGRKNEE